jgi:hypothetical protein
MVIARAPPMYRLDGAPWQRFVEHEQEHEQKQE